MEVKKMNKKKYSNRISLNPLSDARRVQAKERKDDKIKSGNDKGNLKRKLVDEHSSGTDDISQSDLSDKKILLTKADLKARELWHKKSGAGYNLFIQYYASQPVGVVTDDDKILYPVKEELSYGSIQSTKQLLGKVGRGHSRASKKRRKKKNSNSGNLNSGENKKMNVEEMLPTCSNKRVNQTNEKKIDQSTIIAPKLQLAMQHHRNCRNIGIFVTTISEALPLTFRIRQHLNVTEKGSQSVKEFKEKLSQKFNHLVQPVKYDPSQSIYQAVPGTKLTKETLGKISPELKSLILQSTSSELVARQELGSMLPVIALFGGNHMEYGSKVLDMCSSPGSKTLQALEIIASENRVGNQKKPGRIVANDIHPLRIESLKDAILRSGMSSILTDRIVYTNHDASIFPTPKSGRLFDCIIADVPCSGDGTVRKDSRILSGWMPSIGNSLHTVQKKILKRALRLVKAGGVVAYSTCSLNPIEDEAVVASVLSWANKGYCISSDENSNDFRVELLEWPPHVLPSLFRSKGVKSWRVANYIEENELEQSDKGVDDIPQLQWYKSFEDASSDNVPHATQSMWPPSHQHQKYMNLDRCVRLRPQDNNTGGFFVALLKRVS